MEILYTDKRIVVVLKPCGVLSTDEPGGVPSLVRQALGEPDGCVRTVHRLDRVAGGVMVLARSREAARRLSQSVREHTFEKTYYAVVSGTPPQSGTMRDLLARDAAARTTRVTNEPGKDVREAVLHYRTLGSCDGVSLVRVRLETGRTHQIRAQFSSRGFPIVGDVKYAGSPLREGEIALWSCAVSFPHPQTGETVRFFAPPARTDPWSRFPAELFTADENA